MTAFAFVIFLTVASSLVIYVWGRRRPVGKPLTAACPAPKPLVPIFPAVIQ